MSKYPVLSAEKHIDMEAGCLVRFVYGGDDAFYPHSHDYYEIFITASGIVKHMINGVFQSLPEGSLVFIRPDDIHSHFCDDAEKGKASFVNLTFTRETAEHLLLYLVDESVSDKLLSSNMPPSVILNKIVKDKLISQINELNTENWKDKVALKLRMRVILTNLLFHIVNSSTGLSKDDVPLWLGELAEKMSKPENFVLGIDRMIELSRKSREHLSRSFKKYYKMTLTDYINNLRVNYASNLLINTNIPIIDICFSCGFQSLSYFYRVFKSQNKESPHLFRNKYRTMGGQMY